MQFAKVASLVLLTINTCLCCAQCTQLTVSDLLLLNNTPSRQILELALEERGYTLENSAQQNEYMIFRYVSKERSIILEYSETFTREGLFAFINLFMTEASSRLFLSDLLEKGWTKHGDEVTDSNGWLNQIYNNSRIPGHSITFGKTIEEGRKYFRVVL